MSSPAIACYKHDGIQGVVIRCDPGLWRAVLHGLTRLITAHNGGDSGSYDGDTMAGSSCEREQSTRNAYERAIARIGLSKRFRSFLENMQNPENSDGSEKGMGQKTTDAMG